MGKSWFTYADAGQEGPFTEEMLRSLRDEGRINDQTYVWTEGWADWRPLGEVDELQPRPMVSTPGVSAPADPVSGEAPAPAETSARSGSPGVSRAATAVTAVKTRRGPSTGFIITAILLVMIGSAIYGVARFDPDLIFRLSGREHAPPPEVVARPAAPPVVEESPEAAEIRALFDRYAAAVAVADLETLKSLSTRARASELEAPGAAEMLPMLQAMRPSGITIEAVEVSGDEATLTLAAPADDEGGATSGSARFVREEGAWRIASESWKIMMGGEDGASLTLSAGGEETPPAATGGSDAGSFSANEYAKGRVAVYKTGERPESLGPDEELLVLVTGFFSETRIDDPKKARLEFRVPSAEPLSNPRRFEIALDMTRRGAQTFTGNSDVRIIAEGGQIFGPRDRCVVTVTRPWTGAADGVFACEIKDCLFASAGYEFTVSARFTIEGNPASR